MKKTPWGIWAGVFAIAVFYLTLGVVASYIILDAVAGATNTDATLFDQWWQVLLLGADAVCFLGFVISLIARASSKSKAVAKRKKGGKKA